jgi:hypothetical protein
MAMYYKEDWEQARARLLAFWEGAESDRCCVAVTAPRKGSGYASYAALQSGLNASLDALDDNDAEGIRRWWTDPEQNYRRATEWFEMTYFGGEAIPCTQINWGAMAMAAFYGSRPDFRKETVWYHPSITDWSAWEWRFDAANEPYWQQIQAILDCFLQNSPGRYFVGTPEFGSAGDLLSLMRGMERLALDLLEYPEAVEAGIRTLAQGWIDLNESVCRKTATTNQGGGVLNWMLLWGPGRIRQLACDFSSVISPRMFRRFFVPELQFASTWGELGVYHLDGPAAMRSTLDILLELPEIDTIQFTPGENMAPTASPHYLPAYQKIQAAGKRLYLLVKPEEVEPLLRVLSPQGLFLRTSVDTQEQAQDLLRLAERASRLASNGRKQG